MFTLGNGIVVGRKFVWGIWLLRLGAWFGFLLGKPLGISSLGLGWWGVRLLGIIMREWGGFLEGKRKQSCGKVLELPVWGDAKLCLMYLDRLARMMSFEARYCIWD